MDIDNIMRKYCMSIDDVLNVRAIYGGTVSIAPDRHLIFLKNAVSSVPAFRQFF